MQPLSKKAVEGQTSPPEIELISGDAMPLSESKNRPKWENGKMSRRIARMFKFILPGGYVRKPIVASGILLGLLVIGGTFYFESGSLKNGAIASISSFAGPGQAKLVVQGNNCLLYTSPSPRDKRQSRMPSSA